MNQQPSQFWSYQANDLMERLQTTVQGLTEEEAERRSEQYGLNLLKPKSRSDVLTLLVTQFKSPIILILVFAAVSAFFLHDRMDAIIILAIVLISGLLSYWQERGATNAVQKLLSIVQIKTIVLRDVSLREIPVESVTVGDVVVLNAGDVIPGDCLILESKDLFVDEATLTGETYPVEKMAGVLAADTRLSQRTNTLFMGTHVVSGSAKAVVVNIGIETEFGKVSERLELRPPETEFEHGVRQFGYFLMEVTLLLVIAIFAINVYLKRPFLDAFLFSLALAVGLTPQLLPAIISVNLARGAKRMASNSVIVKRLSSIENFGSMNVLCSDKTGTLTEGVVQLHSALDVDGSEDEKVLLFAYLNALYETGYTNPIDEAIRNHKQFDASRYSKLDEVPYDFVRKRLSILISSDGTNLIVTKGALSSVLDVCSLAEIAGGTIVEIASMQKKIQQRFEELSSSGYRTLGVAYRDVGSSLSITRDDEAGMTFLGLLVFFDPPKSGIIDILNNLKQLGISLKMVTGDNHMVATCVGQQVGLPTQGVVTGQAIIQMSEEALIQQVNAVDIFAEVEPNQKERIISALKKSGNVVGYIGDGINDASALHAADVGVSVDSAVDVAKDAADIVLLRKDLRVLVSGVKEGRKTFANTLKYVFMATSANFGNMFSMAGASLFLRFLPLLPKQILLTNLLTDLPEMTISTDNVDPELVEKPRRWDIKFIRRFMLTFGLLSTVFDYATFGILLLVLHTNTAQFRTGWFVESVISAPLVVLVIRSRRTFFKSRPGKYLLLATVAVVALVLALPYIGHGTAFDFEALPVSFILFVLVIVIIYILSAEMVKRLFYSRIGL